MLRKIHEAIRQRTAIKDSLLAHFIKFLYELFAHPYIQMAITAIFPIFISIAVNRATGSSEVISVANIDGVEVIEATPSFWMYVIILTVVYLIVLFLIALANRHKKDQIRNAKIFHQVLMHMATLSKKASGRLNKLHSDLKSSPPNTSHHLLGTDANNFYRFQDVGLSVCKSIFLVLSDHYGCNESDAVVYGQRFNNDGTPFCVDVFAFGTRDDNRPPNLGQGDCLFDVNIYNKYGKNRVIVLHDTQVLENDDEKFQIFCGLFGDAKQYVAVPVMEDDGKTISFVLQVRIVRAEAIGISEHELVEFAYNVLMPYLRLLQPIYECDRIFLSLAELNLNTL